MTRTLDGQSPSRVQSYLGGVSYPASKDQLLDVAKQNRAPVRVLEILRRLNEAPSQFGGPQDVKKACVEHYQGSLSPTPALRRGTGARRRSATARVRQAAQKERP